VCIYIYIITKYTVGNSPTVKLSKNYWLCTVKFLLNLREIFKPPASPSSHPSSTSLSETKRRNRRCIAAAPPHSSLPFLLGSIGGHNNERQPGKRIRRRSQRVPVTHVGHVDVVWHEHRGVVAMCGGRVCCSDPICAWAVPVGPWLHVQCKLHARLHPLLTRRCLRVPLPPWGCGLHRVLLFLSAG
jgi:hypothetical protein